MTVSPGSSFGPYTILAPLGAGGMGAVYRARDAKLGRDLAIKVLPPEFAADRERLARFEQEARSASALNHPNIITIFEVGEAGGTPYIAMEVVEGRSLRDLLEDSRLPLRKTIAIAAQIADALAAAHERGVVHRDLKPENVMVTKPGHVKLLDFGLAKLASVEQSEDTMQMAGHTRPGTVMGTVGYMSPEQASGAAADFRSDQFSLGAIIYEMLTGRRAFQKATSVETLTAILREEPPPIAPGDGGVPAPLRWIVERCLAKTADERYDSTRDLARDLQRVRDSLSDPTLTSGASAVAKPSNRRRWTIPAAAAAALFVVAVAAWLGAKYFARGAAPQFHRLTFRRGFITSARFAPDEKMIVYGAGWEGNPISIFTAREENSESAAMPLPAADILSITKDGRMAISLGRHYTEWFVSNGKLAEAPLSGGGAARELMEDVQDADWFPDGRTLAVAHNGNAQTALEFPPGTQRYVSSGWISHVRVAPNGEHVAFIDHPLRGDDRGYVNVIDGSGKRKALTPLFASTQGIAWRPDGREVWFTGADTGFTTTLHAVTLDGKVRSILSSPSRLILHDISSTGRVLLASEEPQVGAVASTAGGPERDLSWLDCSFAGDISADGSKILLSEQGQGARAPSAVYVRGTDGSPAVRIGDGFGAAISPDGKSIAVQTVSDPPHLLVLPMGAGAPRDLTAPGMGEYLWPQWFPDGKRLAYAAAAPNKPPRLYVQLVDGGKPVAVSPEGVGGGLTPKPISPDGAWIAASGADGKLGLWPVAGGAPRGIPNATAGESALRWSADGKALFTYVAGERPARLYRVEIASGARTMVKEIHPLDDAGIITVIPTVAMADGKGYAYTYLRMSGGLYIVDGLR